MALDLYAKYKAFHLRNAKATGSRQKLHADKCLQLIKLVMDKPTIANANALMMHEKSYLLFSQSNKLHSIEILEAIRSKTYVINRPVINKKFLNAHNPSAGLVYIAQEEEGAQKIKIGYTTLNINLRLRKLRYKYKLKELNLFFCEKFKFPAVIEDVLCDSLKSKRIPGQAKLAGVEWYGVSPEIAVILIYMIAIENKFVI